MPLNQPKTRTISDYILFLRIFLFAAVVPLLMRLRITKLADVLEPGSEPQVTEPEQARKISDYTQRAISMGKPLVRPGCLTLGLTRYYFLRRAGLDVELLFGMGRVREGNGLEGHCWLVRDGEPYLENVDPRSLYVEMWRISRETARRSGATRQSELRSTL
jgi:Transglutaminase-like superfamily